MHQFGTDAAYNWNCGQAFYDTTVRLNFFLIFNLKFNFVVAFNWNCEQAFYDTTVNLNHFVNHLI